MDHKGIQWFDYSIIVNSNQKLKEPDEYGRILVPNYYHGHVLKRFNYPSKITKKWQWYIDYCVAKMKLRFPRHRVSLSLYSYFPDEKPDDETARKREIAAAKAQVSKVLNIMEIRRQELSTQLFQDEENDIVMIKCRAKLIEKKFKLEQLIIK
jgi:hypothetical protein